MKPSNDVSPGREISTPVSGLVLNLDELSHLLHRDRSTIKADRCRAPGRVPPAHKAPGTKEPLWLLDEVLAWLRAHPDLRCAANADSSHRRPGRPRKSAMPASSAQEVNRV